MARYELTESWRVVRITAANKPRGVPRVDDRRVLNGIFWVLRSGSPWADVPERYGPPTTIYNRFNRWRKAGVWDRLMDAIIEAHDGKVQMMNSSVVRVHQQAAAQKTGWRRLYRSKSRRIDHQAAFARCRQWVACSDRTVAGADERPADGRNPAQRSSRRCSRHCGQGL